MADQIWILGAIIVIAVLAQTLLMTWDAFRRVSHQQEQRERATGVLQLRLDAALERREAEKRTSLSWAGWRKFQVRRKQPEDPQQQVCSFYLEPHDGKPIPEFGPGQFLTFKLSIPGQAKPTIRCYSLSDSPKPNEFRVSIKRVPAPRDTDHPPGLSSNHFHDQIGEGDIVDVRAPSGNFFIDMTATSPVVLIGGGVGLTPVVSMLNAIVDAGANRETWFFYGIRQGGEHAMKEHLSNVAKAYPQIHLQICYSNPGPDDVEGRDYHHAARVSADLFKQVLPSNNYDFYMCGPPPMMDSLVAGLEDWDVPADKVHFEKFGPGAPKKKKPVDPAAADAAPGIEVKFTKSGKQSSWTEQVGSLLDLARANGVDIDSGCERGDCGTCQVAIRSGEVVYAEKPAFESESGTCLVCCCVPKGPLELDT
jgi:ferredoxin-NADP reductase